MEKGKFIQMVVTSEDNSLFILDFNEETNELTFRVSRNPEHRQIQKVNIIENIVYTQAYNFHVSYLQNFLLQTDTRENL